MKLTPQNNEPADFDLFYVKMELPADVFYRGADDGMVFIIPRCRLYQTVVDMQRAVNKLREIEKNESPD